MTDEETEGLLQGIFALWPHVMALEDAGITIVADYRNTDAYTLALAESAPEIGAILHRLHDLGETYQPKEIAQLQDPLYAAMMRARRYA